MSSIYGIYQLAGGRGGAERHRCHHTADFQVVTSCVRPGGVLPKKGGGRDTLTVVVTRTDGEAWG